MYDKTLVIDGLLDIEEALLHIIDRTSWIKTANDFATTPKGVDMLDVATIRLMAVHKGTSIPSIICVPRFLSDISPLFADSVRKIAGANFQRQ